MSFSLPMDKVWAELNFELCPRFIWSLLTYTLKLQRTCFVTITKRAPFRSARRLHRRNIFALFVHQYFVFFKALHNPLLLKFKPFCLSLFNLDGLFIKRYSGHRNDNTARKNHRMACIIRLVYSFTLLYQ